jgi:hypothetical protein
VIESKEGLKILDLETKVLRWIRKDLGLQAFLGKEEMLRFGGASETFTTEGVSNAQVLDRILLHCKEEGLRAND